MIDFIKRFKKDKIQYDLFVLKEKAIEAIRNCSVYKDTILGSVPPVQTTEPKPVEVKEPEVLVVPAPVEVPVPIDPVKKKPSRKKTSRKRSK